MPSLNVGDYMEQCLSSVLNQSLKDIEVICVDAGSTDQTLDIIKKHQIIDKRIKIIHSDKKSYGHQVNLGLKEAKGIYISIIETDDYIDENMFKDLYESSKDNTIDIIKAIIPKSTKIHVSCDGTKICAKRMFITNKQIKNEIY